RAQAPPGWRSATPQPVFRQPCQNLPNTAGERPAKPPKPAPHDTTRLRDVKSRRRFDGGQLSPRGASRVEVLLSAVVDALRVYAFEPESGGVEGSLGSLRCSLES